MTDRYEDFRKKLYNNEYSVTEVERYIAQDVWHPRKVKDAEQWLREQGEDKETRRLDRQEGREEESLRLATEANDIAREANKIAKRAKRIAWWAAAVAAVGAITSLLVFWLG